MSSDSDSDVFDSLFDLDISFLENGQMLAPPPVTDQPPPPPHHHQVAPVYHIQEPTDQFVPHPPTEQEMAPYRRLFQSIPVLYIQDSSEAQILPASTLPTHGILPAHPPPSTTQIMEEYSNTDHGILPAVITFPPTGSEPDHQPPPPQQGAPGQDDSKALVLVPPNRTSPPSNEPKNKDVVIDIGSDSESDDSDEVQVLGSTTFTPLDLPLAASTPPPTTTTTPSTSRFGESPNWCPVLLPVSSVDPSGRLRHLLYYRGETTDDEKTETDDDDVLPSPPPPQPSPPVPLPPQQFLEQQLELALNKVDYWSRVVNRGIQGELERPDWLPDDWEMKCVTRTSGSSAGNRDKYYIEPGIRGRKFRSKREVLQFLETGKRRQYKRIANSGTAMPSNVNRPFEGTSSSSWQNFRIASHLVASTSCQNEETAPNLDSDTVPEKQNEETPPNVDSDQNPPKRPCGSPSK